MAFSGDLADYPLAELLFFLSANRRSGWLTIQSCTTEIRFAFAQGTLVAVSSDDIEDRLGQRLIAEGCIGAAELDAALVVQRLHWPTEALGSSLVRLGYVRREDLQRALRVQAVDLIFHILIRPPCLFFFERGLPNAHEVQIGNSLERDVLDAVRRADEWSALQLWSSSVSLNPETSTDMLIGVIVNDWPAIEAIMDGAKNLEEIVVAIGWPPQAVHASLRRLQALEIIFVDNCPQHRDYGSHLFVMPSTQTNGYATAQV